MSYLLTEIALEMLGYKFYDTNGVFHLTNFQQSVSAAQADIHPDEPSLLEFIDQPSSSEPEQNGHNKKSTTTNGVTSSGPSTSSSASSSISVDLHRTPVRALAKIIEMKNEKAVNGREPPELRLQDNAAAVQSSAHVFPKSSANTRRTPARALAKIMDYESFNIRNQITQRLEASLRKNVATNQIEYMKHCLIEEKRKVLRDANEMQKFRQFLEERMRRIDSRPYDTYVRTFGVE